MEEPELHRSTAESEAQKEQNHMFALKRCQVLIAKHYVYVYVLYDLTVVINVYVM